jgi:hypothetical protein
LSWRPTRRVLCLQAAQDRAGATINTFTLTDLLRDPLISIAMRSDGMCDKGFSELLFGVKRVSALDSISGSEVLSMTSHWNIAVLIGLLVGTVAGATAEVPPINTPAARQGAKRLDEMPAVVPKERIGLIDPSGRKQKGRASYYSRIFIHRKMADGQRMNPHSSIAASKNLPLECDGQRSRPLRRWTNCGRQSGRGRSTRP